MLALVVFMLIISLVMLLVYLLCGTGNCLSRKTAMKIK